MLLTIAIATAGLALVCGIVGVIARLWWDP